MTDCAQDPSVANFGIYRRAVIQAILAIRERYYFPLLVRTVGFRLTSIDVEHGARRADRSSYSLAKLLKLAFIAIRANCNLSVEKPSPAPLTTYRVHRLCGFSDG